MLCSGLKMVPGPNRAHPADGQGRGREKGVRGHLVTSGCNVHSPAAARLCFSCTGRVEWKGEPLSFMEHAFLQDGENKGRPKVTGKDVHPLQGPKVPFFAVICGFILSLQTKALYTSASSLQSGDDLQPGPTIGVSREMGNLF